MLPADGREKPTAKWRFHAPSTVKRPRNRMLRNLCQRFALQPSLYARCRGSRRLSGRLGVGTMGDDIGTPPGRSAGVMRQRVVRLAQTRPGTVAHPHFVFQRRRNEGRNVGGARSQRAYPHSLLCGSRARVADTDEGRAKTRQPAFGSRIQPDPCRADRAPPTDVVHIVNPPDARRSPSGDGGCCHVSSRAMAVNLENRRWNRIRRTGQALRGSQPSVRSAMVQAKPWSPRVDRRAGCKGDVRGLLAGAQPTQVCEPGAARTGCIGSTAESFKNSRASGVLLLDFPIHRKPARGRQKRARCRPHSRRLGVGD